MSQYVGNHDPCPHCGLLYKDFKTGTSYAEIWLSMSDNSKDSADWKYKKRNTVMGKWFQIKQELWKKHIEECGTQKEWDEKGYPPDWDDVGDDDFDLSEELL